MNRIAKIAAAVTLAVALIGAPAAAQSAVVAGGTGCCRAVI